MRYVLTLLSWLMIFPILGEIIGRVEYQLPPTIAQQWEVVSQMQDEKSTTKIYVPKGTSRQMTQEFFGVNANKYPSNLDNPLAFKASIGKQFPNLEVEVNILEKGKDSLLYEWIAKEQGNERMYGWGRVFSTSNGTVVLNYQTEDLSKVAKARLDWLPVLKQAKLKQ